MKKIRITDLVLRDAHQSLLATRMLTADMIGATEMLDKVGYWSLETWGGATYDSCIRYLNEDPWERLRRLHEAMPHTKMQMLLRGQNILGYRHYADDVVEKFVELAAKNGIEIFRVFDALNDPRNLKTAIKAVKANKKHAQAAMSYAVTPVHTVDSYIKLGKEFQELGADSICVKDMSGLLKPYTAFELVNGLKKELDIPVHIHSHATTGMSVATLLKSIEAGADGIDTAISSLSMGTSHSPTESMVEMLKATEYDTGLDVRSLTDVAMYFREVRKKYAQFESAFRGADTRILLSQVPGGMLSNLENQLREQDALDKLDEVLDEITIVQRDFGYPPLVTPTSQIVGTQAVFNVIFGRYKNLTGESRKLLVGEYGKTPVTPNSELVQRALKDLELEKPFEERPANHIPNELDKIELKLKELLGKTDISMEDVLTYALFPQVALEFFKHKRLGPVQFYKPKMTVTAGKGEAVGYTVNVNGKDYNVSVREEGTMLIKPTPGQENEKSINAPEPTESDDPSGEGVIIGSPVSGTVFKLPLKEGEAIEEGDVILILESMKMELEVKASSAGKVRYMVKVGDAVKAGDALAEIE